MNNSSSAINEASSSPQSSTDKSEVKPKKNNQAKQIISFIKTLFTKKNNNATNSPKKNQPSGNVNMFHKLLISGRSIIDILDQLATLLNSGIRLVDALIILKQQVDNWALKKLLINIINKVQSGTQLSEALEAHPDIFPKKWTSLVKAGESSGELAKILTDLAADEQEQQKLKSSLKGAMAYPVFVMILSFVLVVYMLLFVVPEISEIYAKMHQKLPGATLFVIALAEFIKQYILVIVGVLVGGIFFIKGSAKYINLVRNILDFIKLRIPIFGELIKKQNIAVFAGNLGLLLKSGVLVVDALYIVREALTNTLYQKEMDKIIKGVISGKRISEEMGLINLEKEEFKNNVFFPLNVSQMIHIGEESGNLSDILERLKNNYINKINLVIKTLSSLLEPFMIIFVGLMIGGILLAVILPFFSMKM